jgi:tetratricopeptide (TPR) repeat protein
LLAAALLSALLAAAPQSQESAVWLQRAGAALQAGRLAEARNAAAMVLKRNPGSGDAEIVLGLADTQEANLASAEAHFRRAAKLSPANYRAHAYLGSTLLRQNRPAEARGAFQRVLELDRGNTGAHYNLGLIGMLEQKPAAALPHFLAVHQADASDVPALIGMLECQLLLKQKQNAAASVRRLQALAPADSPILQKVAATLATHGEYAAAVPLFRDFHRKHPDDYDAAFNLGLALMQAGALDEALSVVQPLAGGSRKGEAANLLGTIHERRGDSAAAIQAFEEAVRLSPGSEDFRIDLGVALANSEQWDKASAVFQNAVRDFPNSVRARAGLGSAYYLRGAYEEAAAALLDAVRVDPSAALTYDLLGKLFESAASRQNEIKAIFQSYLATNPRHAAAYAYYGTMLFLTTPPEDPERIRAARAYLQKALSQDSRLAHAHLQLGILAQEEGKLSEAARFLQRAVALDAAAAPPHYRLSLVYQKLGDGVRAKAELALFQRLKEREAVKEREAMLRSLSDGR